MTKWRPENWNPKITSKPFKGLCSDECLLWAFETGADAMLEARDKWLQEQCQELKPCPCRIYDIQVCDKANEVDLANVCVDFARWYYRREGYALGMAKLWELVDWLEKDTWGKMVIMDIRHWLKAQGIERC
jgi:hypothetical protein